MAKRRTTKTRKRKPAAKTTPKTRATPQAKPPEPKPPIPHVEVNGSRCPKCGSSRREKYNRTTVHPIAGVYQGEPFTHVVWRWTRCAEPGCRQARVDKVRTNLPDRSKGEVEEAFRQAEKNLENSDQA